MYVVMLEFSSQRERARELMAEHDRWLQRGFDDGVFLLAGSLQPGRGGAVTPNGAFPSTTTGAFSRS
jgi:uncharacterized protein YciI